MNDPAVSPVVSPVVNAAERSEACHDLGPRCDVGAGNRPPRQTYAGDHSNTPRGGSGTDRRRELVRAEASLPGPTLVLHFEVRTVGGEAGLALAAAQGRVLRRLLALVAEMEVGRGDRPDTEEVAR